MPNIEVDDEVFAKLQARAVVFVDEPNDVIRRLLEEVEAGPDEVKPSDSTMSASTGSRRSGRLSALVQTGLVKPGEKVTHRRKRSGEVFEAVITEGGCLAVDGVDEPFREPSPALRHFTGSQIDGWANWTHESGASLRTLRARAGQS